MRRLLPVVLILVVASATPALGRKWTLRSGGFRPRPKLVDVRDGNVVLRKEDGSQLTVPLNKLSLGDVRYIDEVLKSAEAAVNGKAEPSAPDQKQGSLTPPTAKPVGVSPIASHLAYQWKAGQSYVYRVKIVGERGDSSEHFSGDVTYKVKSIADDEIELVMTRGLKREERPSATRIFVIPGRHIRFYSEVERPKDVTITVSPLGRVLRIEGSSPLPYLLGDLSQLMIEPLPAGARELLDRQQRRGSLRDHDLLSFLPLRLRALSGRGAGKRKSGLHDPGPDRQTGCDRQAL